MAKNMDATGTNAAPAADGASIDDSELDQIRYSPVCTYCYWWKPSDGHYCGAWPPGGPKKIPDKIWRGASFHITPVGSEKKGPDGKPIVFRPDKGIKRTPENAKLLDAYAAHQPREKE